MKSLPRAYEALVIDRPRLTLVLIAIVTLVLAAFIPRFQMDVSADSLVLENDASLDFYREVRAQYGTDDFLIVTWTPEAGLFSDESLSMLAELRDRLAAVNRVARVTTVLDVPLVRGLTLDALEDGIPTLADPDTDREAAAEELRESPLYKNALVSADGQTAAIQVTLVRDETFYTLLDRRDSLRDVPRDQRDGPALRDADAALSTYREQLMAEEGVLVDTVRSIVAEYADRAEVSVGGLPLIARDITRYIERDVATFGIAVIFILAALLLIIFRQPRWVLVPMTTAAVVGVCTTGFLGLTGWPVTIVSSNFLALLLIFSFSLTIHLAVRHRELQEQDPSLDRRSLVTQTLRDKLAPCFFTVLTTAVAFGSLVVSDIRPVIDFGWIMVFSLWASLIAAYTLFPALLMVLPGARLRRAPDVLGPWLRRLAATAEQHGKALVATLAVITVLAVMGIQKLTVDNRFIDYFDKRTDIHRGLALIDARLGGTTPLDVLIDAPAPEAATPVADADAALDGGDSDDFDDEFADLDDEFGDEFDDPFADSEAGLTATSYWFRTARFAEIAAIHEYLESLPETGNVMSLHSTIRVLAEIDQDIAADNFALAILERKLPDDIRAELIAPYLSEDGQQLRIAVRVLEGNVGLDRQALLEKIQTDIRAMRAGTGEALNVSGMIVLYNNLLQSLFSSQIQTIGVIFIAILITFVISFRSLAVATVAIIPNLLPAAVVLGVLGWAGIPLDIMTITIAAITIGIGVDNAIHYVHRFEIEWLRDRSYERAALRAHDSIGRAMLYTSLCITIGFVVLVLSNFNPTIYFGALTALAMVTALLVNITLLPLLLRVFRPYGS
ncbi:MAG: MMPL family transporter [Pseudomonadota bacterium]